MLITLATMVLLAAIGAFRAYRGKGKTADILHYAATHAIIGLILGTLLTIGLSRAL